MSETLEAHLADLAYFSVLREDERLRVAERFRTVTLAEGDSYELARSDPKMVVVLEGAAQLVEARGGRTILEPGDVFGDVDLLVGRSFAVRVRALEPTKLAMLDRPTLDQLFEELPAIAPPWLAELAREVKRRNDLVRDALAIHDADLPTEALEQVLARRRKRRRGQQRSAVRTASQRLVRALITVPGTRPSFWVLVGIVLSLALARTVVAVIIQNGLQKSLFALIGGEAGNNPIHVHHFNYGLLLVIVAGALALVPRARGGIKRLSFVFGFGLGLIVDEFALLWNLNPDYYQPLSRAVAGMVVLFFVQVVYFRTLYLALAKRVLRWVQS